MGLGELLDRIRELYLAAFVAEAERRRRPGVRVQCESTLLTASGEPACEGALGLPLRVDLVVLSGGEVVEKHRVVSGRMIAFAPISFDWVGRLRVRLGPFFWDCLDFRIPAPPGADWGPLAAWFREWFDEEDEGEDGLFGVVHFLSDPQTEDGGVCFQADLGSAPVEAFEGLLDAVAALGAPEVVIGRQEG
jgi:hypothetical protein